MPTSAGSTSSSLHPPTSPAREVYLIPEVRKNILQLLSKPDLASFMRVQKKGMADVAEILYHTMEYSQVRSRMSMSTERQRTYLNAIKVIDARHINLGPAMLKKTSLVIKNPRHRSAETAAFLRQLHVDVFDLVVPPMRRKCQNVSQMTFGSVYEPFNKDDSWTVTFYPSDAKRTKSTTASTGGRIDYIRTERFRLDSEPFANIRRQADPDVPDGYDLHVRYDLELVSDSWADVRARPCLTDKWLLALRNDPRVLLTLHKAVNFDVLPITFDDIISLYQRLSANSLPGLETVIARNLTPYSIDDLRGFSIIAGASLVSLDLTAQHKGGQRSHLPFSELPTLLNIIRQNLPNLHKLWLAVNVDKSAASSCCKLLTDDSLEGGGGLKMLRIVPTSVNTLLPSALDLIRLVAPICSSRAQISVLSGDPFNHYDSTQTQALHYLRSQDTARRKHLATIGFAVIGVTSMKELSRLDYRPGGRPRALWKGYVARLKLADALRRVKSDGVLDHPYDQRNLHHCVRLAEELESTPGYKPTSVFYTVALRLSRALTCSRLRRPGLAVRTQDIRVELDRLLAEMQPLSGPIVTVEYKPYAFGDSLADI